MKKSRLILPAALLALVSFGASLNGASPPSSDTPFKPTIPKTWDDAVMTDLELPLPESSFSPKHVPAEYYYRIPVRPIYKSYPVYHPSKEPPGYFDRLRQQEPVVLWDDKERRPKLQSEADWIEAGEMVFDSPGLIGNGRISVSTNVDWFLRDPKWYERTAAPTTREGVLPFYRFIIREKGKVEVGILSCAMCHTRVMSDGSVLKGAQGNFPFDRAFAEDYRSDPDAIETDRKLERALFHAPWLRPNPQSDLDRMTSEQIASPHAVIPPGVLARHRTRPEQPVQVADLIGVKERRYLDSSGLQHHRGIGDLMRYAALNQGGDDLSRWGDFIPLASFLGGKLPDDPRDMPKEAQLARYSDEQLYALALYIYSLKPPPNPNKFDALAKRGEEIFHEEGCAKCHDPKQGYTNNKLIRAPGFEVPANHPERDNIMRQRVNTDPGLTLTTRRGTGFYKVPSLLGVWYRGPFEHNGSVATLEDWFDPARLNEDYVPTGWKGPPGTKTRAVKGHEFGLDLSEDERKALIAFLRTL